MKGIKSLARRAKRPIQRADRGRRRVLDLETLEKRYVLDSTVVINEIMYHAEGDRDALEWIELYNQLALDMDLSGWSLRGGVEYEFPRNTVIPADGYLVIAANPAELASAGVFSGALGPFSGRLANGGEELLLYNNSDRIMDRLDYSDDAPWPAGPDGSSATLAKIDPRWTSLDPSNWRASEQPNGTPGQLNFAVPDLTPVATVAIPMLSEWRYDDAGVDRGTSWRTPAFDDTAWPVGEAYLHAGEETFNEPELGLRYLPISSDADSGISSEKAYTHALDFGSAATAVINGVAFDPVTVTTLPEISDFQYNVSSGIQTTAGAVGSTNVTGEMHNLLSDYVTNSINQANGTATIILSGLTLGAHYDTRLYTRQAATGVRNVTLAYDTDGAPGAEATTTINQNDASQSPPGFPTANQAYAISYDFVAQATQLTITITQSAFNQPFLLFGLTNEARGGEADSVKIHTLFGTGVGDNGRPLSPGSPDPHWYVTSTQAPLLTMSPNPAWNSGTSNSQWAGVVASGATNVPPGTYSFSTQFDLSEYDAQTAEIVMRIAVDDSLTAVRLNGVDQGITTSGFDVFRGPFTLDDGFLPGLNTLEFVITNGGTSDNPSGLHVQFESRAVGRRDRTEVAEGPNTHYFRQEFTYTGDPDASHLLQLDGLADDGAVYYLNGTEIYRHNMPAGPIEYSTPASRNVVTATPFGAISLPSDALLVNGSNVLAVEVHQSSGNQDVRFAAQLTVIETPTPPSELPQLVINEIHSALSDMFYVELANTGDSTLSLADFHLRVVGTSTTDYPLPAGSIEAGGYRTFTAAQIGGTPISGQRIFLMRSVTNTVLDGQSISNTLRGRSLDWPDRWLFPTVPTPAAENVFDFTDDVVINEIMYHPQPHFARPSQPAVVETTTLIPFNQTWRYNETGNDLGADWHQTSHAVDNTSWFAGPGLLGFEVSALAEPIRTQLHDPQSFPPVVTYYFETEFEYTGDLEDDELRIQLRHMIDDGAIFYLNGAEWTRFNMPAGPVNSTTPSAALVGNAALVGPIELPKSLLQIGTNRLSVEVHQAAGIVSDIVFGAELAAVRELAPATPSTPFEESSEEWFELTNRGTETLDLSGWTVTGGIDFEFPDGTTIAPGAFLVVANNAPALQSKYPGIDILGNFERGLSDKNDEILLLDARGNPADHVHYFEGGRWPLTADGGGSSLELRDVHADNSRGEAWGPSFESDAAQWQTITYRGPAREAPGSNNPAVWNEFIFGLLDAGEILVDDVSVIEDPGGTAIERIQNGSFDQGTDHWRLVGNHGQHGLSGVIPEPGNPANQVLHVVATGATEHMSNQVQTTFVGNAPIVTGREYEISMRVKWLTGSPQLNTRLYFNRLARTTILETPNATGTPGEANSIAVANIGPTFDKLSHFPVIPTPVQSVTVSVDADDNDALASIVLHYSVDGGPWQTTGMSLNSDGRYAGLVPPQDPGAVVQFYVEATDTLGAVSVFPAGGQKSRALFQVQDNAATNGPHHNLRIIATPSDWDFVFERTNFMTNHRTGVTVVFNEQQVYYDVQLRLKGSGFSRGSAATGFNLRFHPDHFLFGEHDVVAIDRQGGPWGIGASHRELTLKHIGNAAGDIPMMYDDAIYLIAPDSDLNGTAQFLVARYDDVFLESQFENGGEGTRFKFDLIYYSTLTENGNPEGLKLSPGNFPSGVFPVLGVDIRDMGSDPNTYRWNYLIRNNRARDDYSQIIAMGKAFQLTGSTVDGPLDRATQAVIDVDQWMRLFAFESLVGINDTYNQGLEHNLEFFVRPEDNRVVALPWDMDFSFHHSTTTPIYGTGSNLRKVIDIPSNTRLFQGHLHDIITTTFNTTYLTPWIQHIATRSAQNNTTDILNYVNARRNFVLSQLMPQVAFQITTNNGNNFSVNESTATLTGDGWINVREIRLAGDTTPLPVKWTDRDSWRLDVALHAGANPLTLQAYDFQGNLIASDSITITSSAANPILANLRITEINYNPGAPTADELLENPNLDNEDLEFVELTNFGSVPLQLLNVRMVEGAEVTLPDITLQPGQRGVIVQNTEAFQLRYGSSPLILGEFASGQLSNGGERLLLVDANGDAIADIEYEDSGQWPSAADGLGATLVVRNDATAGPAGDNPVSLWRASTEWGGSPGNVSQPSIGVVVSEVLANTDTGSTLLDAIELHNTSDQAIDLSGWYLSDSGDTPQKFAIPPGTMLPPGGIVVFTESDFNPTPESPAPHHFALSGSEGDDVWLVELDSSGRITTFVDEVHFGATLSGQALGRIANGTDRIVPMGRPSLGCENSNGWSSGVVISEIQFRPGQPSPAAIAAYPALTSDQLEFVEFHNGTLNDVDMSQWVLSEGIDWQFPLDTTLESGASLLVVSFNPADPSNANLLSAFRIHYGITPAVRILGPFDGGLRGTGELLELRRPTDPPSDDPTVVPYVPVDSVAYQTSAPWPVAPQESGQSLQRIAATGFGDLSTSWAARAATPGSVDFSGTLAGDFSGDGAFDGNDLDLLWDAIVRQELPHAALDLDDSLSIDADDVAYLLENIFQTRFGDANLDGQVDSADLETWNTNRFHTCGTWRTGDFNGDGFVDGSDFNAWNANKFRLQAAAPAAARRTPRAALPATVPSPPVINRISTTRAGGYTDASHDVRSTARRTTEDAVRQISNAHAIALRYADVSRWWADVARRSSGAATLQKGAALHDAWSPNVVDHAWTTLLHEFDAHRARRIW